MSFIGELPERGERRRTINAAYRADETTVVDELLAECKLPPEALQRIDAASRKFVEIARATRLGHGGLDAFLQEYSLSSAEGIVLMCLAEALLRIPDAETADKLIRDKMGGADWERHLGKSESVLVNASTWGLMLTGRMIRWEEDKDADLASVLGRLVSRSSEPIVRQAMMQAMRIMGRQFVMGRTIEEALERAGEGGNARYLYSFDMLGEAAYTAPDAERYFKSYLDAIAAIGGAGSHTAPTNAVGISVKLSALHPRYELAQRDRVMAELVPRLGELASAARDVGIGMTVDAEEATRLDISLDVFEAVYRNAGLSGWDGFGLAVQAYQKRARHVIDWIADLARSGGRRIMVRLVKGAYWDSEIKHAQELGFDGYPVFTRKTSTDVSYLACARRMIADADVIYPQFATHNAHTLAVVKEMAGDSIDYEFQRLHGMGEPLYEQIVSRDDGPPVRVYAPVGSHEDLLPYLVRRLLENGANTSFVNRLVDEDAAIEDIIADPVAQTAALRSKPHPRIPPPRRTVEPGRESAIGVDLSDEAVLTALAERMRAGAVAGWQAGPVVNGSIVAGRSRDAHDPADQRRVVGHVTDADEAAVERALKSAAGAAWEWDALGGAKRAARLERAADLYERNMADLMAACVREGGKSIPDSVAEVREAVDFLRYYAGRARAQFAEPMTLPGPTGESNSLALHGRGVFACISPWNFPLAIFTGEMAAALAAGNAVIAKPAEQTPMIAMLGVRLLHQAGVPGEVLHFLPGSGETVGKRLVEDRRIAGVAFTGSTETGRAIARGLAGRDGPIVPLIAETGGQNAMIVDSSALPEQVVRDVVTSAFLSAGQRCSACRVLFLQQDVAGRILDMLTGAMAELVVGDPALLRTDVGPIIDREALDGLTRHIARMEGEGTILYRTPLGEETAHGTFLGPCAVEIDRLSRLEREVFGPVLHVIRYDADRLDDVLQAIVDTGYGLTLGIHSRIDETIRKIHAALPVGNSYVNRHMVGAIVGVQPFGGERLSGTGPKAGGPNYLPRFAVERSLSVNTAAMGGNASLLSLDATDEPGLPDV